MLEQLRQISFLIASLRQNLIAITQENEELRKRYSQLQNEYDLMKNEYDECKRNLEKTTQETSNSES
jgi:chromosome segregation ATPase